MNRAYGSYITAEVL